MYNKMLIAMYEKKDPKRKRKLFDFFKEIFQQNLSAKLTVEMINKELGEELTTLYDVKYIRARMTKWSDQKPAVKVTTAAVTVESSPARNVGTGLTRWSDADEIKSESFSSKFN